MDKRTCPLCKLDIVVEFKGRVSTGTDRLMSIANILKGVKVI